MAAKKKVDPIKQREKRAKIAAIGGVVLLLAVAAWQGPKMMKLMNQKPVVPPTSAAPAGTSGLPGVDGTTAATGATPAGELADTDLPPVALDGGQLVSFDVFQTKDPFRPQVTNADLAATDTGSTATQSAQGASPDTSSTTTTSATPTIETPASTTPATTVPPSPSAPTAPSAPQTTTNVKPAAPSVSVSVNGTTSHVARGGAFPTGTPVFRLVSWAKGTARIGIVGGSYSTGDPTLELTLDKPVTLQNTSNGQRYKLVLLSTP